MCMVDHLHCSYDTLGFIVYHLSLPSSSLLNLVHMINDTCSQWQSGLHVSTFVNTKCKHVARLIGFELSTHRCNSSRELPPTPLEPAYRKALLSINPTVCTIYAGT